MAICFKIFIIFSFVLNPALQKKSFASTIVKSKKILIRSTDANLKDYEKYIIENKDFVKPNFETIIKYSFSVKPNHILNLQNLAETEFLDADVAKSVKTYKKIVSLSLKEIWPQDVQNIIFQSYFRLAQLEKENEEFWIQKAIDYAMNLKPNSSKIPLGLIQTHEKLSLLTLNDAENMIPLNKLSDQNIRINGSNTLSLVNKNIIYRLDRVSEDSLPSVSYVLGSKILNYKFNSLMFEGLCNNIKPNTETPLTSEQFAKYNHFYVFSSTKCDPIKVSSILNQSLSPARKIIKTNSNPLILSLNPNPSDSTLPRELPLKTNLEQNTQTWTENSGFQLNNENKNNLLSPSSGQLKIRNSKKSKTWIYIGSAVLALTLGAMFVHQQNDNSKTYESTQRQGF